MIQKLIRFGLRDYDPETGRWTSVEPLGFAGSRSFRHRGNTRDIPETSEAVNWYVYGADDPVGKIDLDGRAYRCQRALNGIPFKIGFIYHEYICTNDGICGGLTTNYLDYALAGYTVKSRWTTQDEDKLNLNNCQEIKDDDENCIDNCLKNVFRIEPQEDYNIGMNNCQDFARDLYEYCNAECGIYNMDSYDSINF